MREGNSGQVRTSGMAAGGWAAIILASVVLCASPGMTRESTRPAQANRAARDPSTAVAQSRRADVRVLERVSYGGEAPQAQVLKALSPIEYVTRDSPPVFLTSQGPADAFWPGDARLKWDVHTPITSLILEKKLKESQVPYELVISPGGGRGDTTLLRRELAFLAKYLHLTAGQQGDSSRAAGGGQHYSLGAKFEPPVGRVVHGMGQWEQYNAKLLPLLPPELRPASKLIFISIGDTPRGWRPEGIRNLIGRYDQEGLIPHVDIALRGNQPSHAARAALADPLFGIDHEVASSTRFDERIQDLVRIVKEFGKPVIVRIGGEFNGRWNGYHPYAYPQAFRKIVEMFRAAKADNVAFVWCYEPAAPGDFDERNDAGAYKWFPGDDVIDWFAIDWFNREDFTGPLTGGRRGQNAMTAHGRSRKFLDMAVAHQRPVMIAESAPCRYDLSDPAQAEAAWQEWFEPYFQTIADHNEIKWFHLISFDWTRSSYYVQTGWKNNDFTVSPALLEKLVAELRKPQYLHAGDKALLKDYSRFAAAPAVSRASSPRRADETPPPRNPALGDKPAELAKFDQPAAHLPARGPGGTEWDAQYRSFIQSDENAVSKGFPTHAEAFLAAVGATPEQFMTDPDIRRRLKEASPVFLVSSDDLPALVVGAGPAETAVVPPTVPDTINDPHSAWQGALLADALRRAGVEVVARLGAGVGKDSQADAVTVVDFLTRHLKPSKP
jgi:hypothetical protein